MKKEWEDRDWVQWLSDNLKLPFEVRRVHDKYEYLFSSRSSKNKPFRVDHIFDVISIESFDPLYGIVVKAKEGRRAGFVALSELELIDKSHNNVKIIDEFVKWYEITHL